MDNEIAKLPKTISVLEEYSKNRKDRAEIYNNFIETLKKLYNQNVDNNATLEAEKLGLAKEVKNLSKSIITNPNDNKTKEALDNFALRVNNLESKVKTKNTTNKTNQQPVSNQQVAQQKTNQKEQQQQVKQPVVQQPVAQQVQPIVLSREKQEFKARLEEKRIYIQDKLAMFNNAKQILKTLRTIPTKIQMMNDAYDKQIHFYIRYNNLLDNINNNKIIDINDKTEQLIDSENRLSFSIKTGENRLINLTNSIKDADETMTNGWVDIYNKQMNISEQNLDNCELRLKYKQDEIIFQRFVEANKEEQLQTKQQGHSKE